MECRLRKVARPGSEHVKQATAIQHHQSDVLISWLATTSCIMHSQGRPTSNPIEGKYYDWTRGLRGCQEAPGHWKLEEHKLGETTFTHFADGTAHKNRMRAMTTSPPDVCAPV